jgi:hypothetical protein
MYNNNELVGVTLLKRSTERADGRLGSDFLKLCSPLLHHMSTNKQTNQQTTNGRSAVCGFRSNRPLRAVITHTHVHTHTHTPIRLTHERFYARKLVSEKMKHPKLSIVASFRKTTAIKIFVITFPFISTFSRSNSHKVYRMCMEVCLLYVSGGYFRSTAHPRSRVDSARTAAEVAPL